MKKVLILCDAFPPAFAPRMGYLVKYLKESGWQAVAITEEIPQKPFTFLKGICETLFVDYYKDAKSPIHRQYLFLMEFLFGKKNKQLYQLALTQTQKHHFDLILCSTYRSFPLDAARKLSKETGLPLIVDLRDIVEQFSGYEMFAQKLPSIPLIRDVVGWILKKRSFWERNAALKAASHVTTVSPWHVETLKKFNPNTSLIYNGYDPEFFYPAPVRNSQFTITYTGRLISLAVRNPDLFFLAVKRLSDEGIFSANECRIQWYIDEVSQELLRVEACKYGLEEYMDYPGYVSGSEIPKVLNQSSVLLVLANKSAGNGPKGIMTTKLFESLAVERPLLCVRSDEDCLEAVIKKTNIGLAARTEQEAYDFLKHHYLQWKSTGLTYIDVNHKEVKNFSRKEQALQFLRLFDL